MFLHESRTFSVELMFFFRFNYKKKKRRNEWLMWTLERPRKRGSFGLKCKIFAFIIFYAFLKQFILAELSNFVHLFLFFFLFVFVLFFSTTCDNHNHNLFRFNNHHLFSSSSSFLSYGIYFGLKINISDIITISTTTTTTIVVGLTIKKRRRELLFSIFIL